MTTKMKAIYLTLFHGRKKSNQEMREQGFMGPLIGPVNISFTYGNIKLHPADWNDFAFLPIQNDCIRMPEGFFGDMEVILASDDILKDIKRRIYSWEEFSRYANFPAQVKQYAKQMYGLDLRDMDLTNESLWTLAAEESITGEEWVEEHARKYDLDLITD